MSKFEAPTLKQADIKGKDILYKVDFNVPLKEQSGSFTVADDARIEAVRDTIEYIESQKPKRVIFLTHLGRPKGRVMEEFSTKPVAEHLGKLYKKDVAHIDASSTIPEEGWIMYENVRFNPREESEKSTDRKAFAKELSDLVDEDGIIVYDAFGAAHRKQASAYELIAERKAYAGLLMQAEIEQLIPFINPGPGSVAFLGGAKIEDKLAHVEGLLKKYDTVALGGGMVFTFYKAMGHPIGKSILFEEKVADCKKLFDTYGMKEDDTGLILPSDVRIAKITNPEVKAYNLTKADFEDVQMVSSTDIPNGYNGLDMGDDSITRYEQLAANAKVIFWNGPMGVFEVKGFEKATKAVGKAIEKSKATKIAGGGDTLNVLAKYDLNMPSSTGGGAATEFVIHGTLPGYEALKGNFN